MTFFEGELLEQLMEWEENYKKLSSLDEELMCWVVFDLIMLNCMGNRSLQLKFINIIKMLEQDFIGGMIFLYHGTIYISLDENYSFIPDEYFFEKVSSYIK